MKPTATQQVEKKTKIKDRLKQKKDTVAGEILRRGTRGLRYQAQGKGKKVEVVIKRNEGKVTDEVLECFIECTGSSDPMLIAHLLAQAQEGIMVSYEDQEKVAKTLSAVTTMLRGIGPKDEVEGMLAVQLTVTHHQALEYLALSLSNRLNPELAQVAVNTATRLMRTFINLIEALIKYRNRNEANQRIRVDHVHVHQGGQAIVGSTVNHAGGEGVKRGNDESISCTGLLEGKSSGVAIELPKREAVFCEDEKGNTMPHACNEKRTL
jgi:hypothetical protein